MNATAVRERGTRCIFRCFVVEAFFVQIARSRLNCSGRAVRASPLRAPVSKMNRTTSAARWFSWVSIADARRPICSSVRKTSRSFSTLRAKPMAGLSVRKLDHGVDDSLGIELIWLMIDHRPNRMLELSRLSERRLRIVHGVNAGGGYGAHVQFENSRDHDHSLR